MRSADSRPGAVGIGLVAGAVLAAATWGVAGLVATSASGTTGAATPAGAGAGASTPAIPQRAARLDRDYPVQPVPFTAVHLTDDFWAPKIQINEATTIPVAFEQCEVTGRVENFIRAATVLRGDPLANTKPPGYPFDDTDLYKVIEGASYTLAVHRDPALEKRVDDYIATIAAAQEPDGYLYTTRTINPAAPHPWAGRERWELEKVDSHELYNFGHLTEAAVAHYQATGKRTLLDVATRFADLLVATFGPGKRAIWPGHQITEMALVRLYRVTGRAEYLDLAKFMLDVRKPDAPASSNHPASYHQAQAPVIEQTEAVGHAVRATYMYSGMADVAAMTGDAAYLRALEAIWSDVVTKKLYLTGGIGATGSGEAFGKAYELPNMTAYAETCASVGNDFWNERMFLLSGDAKYVDVLERTLYNGLISGVALDGKTFFYPNVLESRGQHARQAWFGVACCPSNITRFMASVPGYVYARQDDTIFVNLFAAGTADVTLGDGRTVTLTQETAYPREGDVKLVVTPAATGEFAIKVRIPGWARDEPVPGDLYRFVGRAPNAPTLVVNGRQVPIELDRGYVRIRRAWNAGDTIVLHLPMDVRRVVAHDAVEADAGRVAFQRGPFVYAAEWPDNPDGRVRNLVIPDDERYTAALESDLLGGVVTITGQAVALTKDADGRVVRKAQPFKAIPYYAWANRGRGEMAVWLPRTESVATPAPFPTLAMRSTVTVSGQPRRSPTMINDGEDPRDSADSSAYFDWWPTKGTSERVDVTFPAASTVSEIQVYWFDDTGRGEVRVPQSWRLLYRDGDAWKPVRATGAFGTDRNRYNVVSFAAVTTGALRIELTMQPGWSAGVQEVKVR
ncbi:MAG: glycoside hydrolase family 127 protein [Vicinamibacterales bacterium]